MKAGQTGPGRPIPLLHAVRIQVAMAGRILLNRMDVGLRRLRRSPKPGRGIGFGAVFLVAILLVSGLQSSFSAFFVITEIRASTEVLGLSSQTVSRLEELSRGHRTDLAAVTRALDDDSAYQAVPVALQTRYAQAVLLELNGAGSAPESGAHLPGQLGDIQGCNRCLCAYLLLLAGITLLANLANGVRDLGQVENKTLWLSTMPVPTASLHLAAFVEAIAMNLWLWIVFLPATTILYWAEGCGAWCFVLGPVATLLIGVVLASIRLTIETWLRIGVRPLWVRNSQALCSILFIALVMLVVALPNNAAVLPWLVRHVRPLPLQFQPMALPQWMAPAGTGGYGAGGLLLALAVTIAIAYVGISLATYWTRGGFVVQTGSYLGRRTSGESRGAGQREATGSSLTMLGKDLLLLRRDRNLMMQMLAMPVMIFGGQLLINPVLRHALLNQGNHAIAFAFSFGAYFLTVAAVSAVIQEGKGIWLWYVAPATISSQLRRKARLYAMIAVGATGITMLAECLIARRMPDVWLSLVAIGGVVIYADILVAVGALGVRPHLAEVRRQVPPMTVYAGMTLVSMYAYAIYSPSIHLQLVQLVLSLLVAFSLWQKVEAKLPYLLDPTSLPTRRLDLADGMIAILAFFVLQGLLSLAFAAIGFPVVRHGHRLCWSRRAGRDLRAHRLMAPGRPAAGTHAGPAACGRPTSPAPALAGLGCRRRRCSRGVRRRLSPPHHQDPLAEEPLAGGRPEAGRAAGAPLLDPGALDRRCADHRGVPLPRHGLRRPAAQHAGLARSHRQRRPLRPGPPHHLGDTGVHARPHHRPGLPGRRAAARRHDRPWPLQPDRPGGAARPLARTDGCRPGHCEPHEG